MQDAEEYSRRDVVVRARMVFRSLAFVVLLVVFFGFGVLSWRCFIFSAQLLRLILILFRFL